MMMVVLWLVDVRAMAKAIRATSHGRLRLGGGRRSFYWALAIVDQARQHTSLTEVWGDCPDIILLHDSQHVSGVKPLLDK